MSLDLFKIYKAYIQRCRRKPNDLVATEIKENMAHLIKSNLTQSEMIEVARGIQSLEEVRGYRKLYAWEMIKSIEGNDYVIKIPYPVLHRWNENENTLGSIYLGVAKHKKGQVKIGATTISTIKIEDTYFKRHGYSMKIIWEQGREKPFSYKKTIQEHYQRNLVAGLTSGDSNEWYYGEVNEMVKTIERLIS